MNAAAHYVWRNLGRRRTRSLLGVLGIALTLALLTAIQIGLDSVSVAYTDLAALQAGKADVVIQAEGSSPLRPEPFFDAEVRSKLAANPLLRGLSPRLFGIVVVGAGTTQHYAVLIGLDPRRERQFDLSGLAPEPVLADGMVAVSRGLVKRLGVKAGADLTLRSAQSTEGMTLRLEAAIDRQLLLPQEVKDFVVVNEGTARTLLNEAVQVHALAGALRDPTRLYDARDLHASVRRLKDAGESIAAELGTGYDLRLPKAAAIAAFQYFTSPIRAFFGVFALLALTITALLIYSIVSVAVEERIREYAILRTLGGRRRDIVRLVLAESLLLCGSGVVPGVLGGVVLAKIGVRVTEKILRAEGGQISLHVSLLTLGLAAGIGVLLAVGSALIPAVQAVRWRIVDGLDPLRRGQVAELPRGGEGGQRSLLFLGSALTALSGVVFFVLPPAFLSGNPSLIGTVVLCLLLTILLGLTLVAIGLLPWAERAVLAVVGRWFAPVTELAARNLVRHRRRNTTTAVMFILSVSWVIFIASLAALFSRTSLALVEHFNGADIRIQAEASSPGIKGELAGLPGVEAVAEVKYLRGRSQAGIAYDVVIADLVGLKQLWVVPFGADPDLARALYLERVKYVEGGPEAWVRLAEFAPKEPVPSPVSAPTGDTGAVVIENALPAPAAAPVATGRGDEVFPVILSESVARYLDVQRGDLVRLSFRLGAERRDRRCRVEAVCGAVPGFDNFRSRVAHAVGSGVLMPMAAFDAMARPAPLEAMQTRLLVRTKPGESVQRAVAQKIRDDFDVRHRFGVKSTVERKVEAQRLYWATQILFGLLLAVAIVIAVFALIASMATSVIERRWEIGVLKALGLRQSQLFRMFLGEAVVLTLATGLVGGAIGFSLAYLFVLQAAALMEVPVVFTLPYLTFAATFGLSLVAGALAAHLPTRRLLQRPAAEILRGTA
jgi:putative ABC transport system permease protein